MSNLPEIYNESVDLFYKTFDVPKLCFEILSKVKNPATCGRLYDVEVINVTRELFRIKIEFRTDESTYFDMVFNLESSPDRAENFCGQMGFSIDKIEQAKGKKYKVFYANMFETMILGKIND